MFCSTRIEPAVYRSGKNSNSLAALLIATAFVMSVCCIVAAQAGDMVAAGAMQSRAGQATSLIRDCRQGCPWRGYLGIRKGYIPIQKLRAVRLSPKPILGPLRKWRNGLQDRNKVPGNGCDNYLERYDKGRKN